MNLQRWVIRVTGIVQGVGYRPFVYKLAGNTGVLGSVWNDQAGVVIDAVGLPATLQAFKISLEFSAPPLAVINSISHVECALYEIPECFKIAESVKSTEVSSWVAPDYDVCEECLQEMRDPRDRRYRYPFINCTNCGPRYSIIRSMPYDRIKTTMCTFTMCCDCEQEYLDPASRRFHAQPIACPNCGPEVELLDAGGALFHKTEAITEARRLLFGGKILGVKSIGGFHLAARANDEVAIKILRKRKKRDSKPFAVMVRDVETARTWADVSDQEAAVLTSSARPIVLLRKKTGTVAEAIAPRNPMIGLMLPSAPLHYLLLEDPTLGSLVMTSANLSGRPICYENHEALGLLKGMADCLLVHNRDIQRRVDDSVVRVTLLKGSNEPFLTFVRRSRGYAPFPVSVALEGKNVLAYGAELKTTIAVSKQQQVFVSQHIGDLKNNLTLAAHEQCAKDLCQLNDVRPAVIACDMHPLFSATRSAMANTELPVVQVQHHHAHMASCMAENNLAGLVLGVIFDGTGYGTDGTIWGAEFLLGDYTDVRRVATIRPLKLLGGDAAIKDPSRVAVALLCDAFESFGDIANCNLFQRLGAEKMRVYEVMYRRNVNSVSCTSMGRLFDGIASLIGVCDNAEYEAQGPIELEGLLGRDHSLACIYSYGLVQSETGLITIDYRAMVRQIVTDLAESICRATISRKFHSTIVDMIRTVCRELSARFQANQIVLSGGVFMNEFLLVNAYQQLKALGLNPHLHKNLPSNDAGISYGQIAVATASMKP
ncbi:carbamoyltransferase HypF [Pseudomonas sp. FP597]|uniref:carbamoyltransferase HypF n=1 Tax=Pseudomonas sp. FP597 TaxID=2954096 RepID=UPI00273451DA|nr:carbamoyltransferase HypF [Pseudomonas sp. FP597]WLI07440.1 carbamoyltransferase HypF [Pseudomonas sp. FP597]